MIKVNFKSIDVNKVGIPKSFTEFHKYMLDKYIGKQITSSLPLEVEADIEGFVRNMVRNALLNQSVATDTIQFLKNIITID